MGSSVSFLDATEEGIHFFWKNKFATAPEFHHVTLIAQSYKLMRVYVKSRPEQAIHQRCTARLAIFSGKRE